MTWRKKTTSLKLAFQRQLAYDEPKYEFLKNLGYSCNQKITKWPENFIEFPKFCKELNCTPVLVSAKTLLLRAQIQVSFLESSYTKSCRLDKVLVFSLPDYEPVFITNIKMGSVFGIQTRNSSSVIDKNSVNKVMPLYKGLTDPLLGLVPSIRLEALNKELESNNYDNEFQ
jgi:hypothetical protein